MRQSRRSMLALPLAATLSLGLAACAGGEDVGSTPQAAPVTDAPTQELTADDSGAPEPLSLSDMADRLTAAMRSAGAVSMTKSVDGDTRQVTSHWVFDGESSRAHMPVEMGGGFADVIVVGGQAYIQWPPDPEYYQVDADDTMVSMTPRGQGLDPWQELDGLSDAIDIELVGADEIDGIAVSEYLVTFDLEILDLDADLPSGDATRPTVMLTRSYYVDAQDRLVRVVTSAGVDPDITLDFRDWGVAQDIVAPPADQVLPMGAVS